MAALIKMICTDCGYNSGTLRLGPTFMDARYIMPALDIELQQIVSVDVNSMPASAIPYSNEKLFKKTTDDDMLHEVNLFQCCDDGEPDATMLSKQHNFCPACNSFSLAIKEYGFMD